MISQDALPWSYHPSFVLHIAAFILGVHFALVQSVGLVDHGFVLDEKGLKMSKSLGNVVDPRTIIEGGKNQEAPSYGADVLKLSLSSVDYTGDVLIGPQVLHQMSDIYRKLRGTLRFLLGNLHDWKTENAIAYDELPEIDQHALFQLESVVKNIKESYESYQFFRLFQTIQQFAIVDLSNFYFDVAKECLYVGGASSFTRRSFQTVLAVHLLSIVRVIAPILPHLAEDVWQNLPFEYNIDNTDTAKVVFESKWPKVNERWLAFSEVEIDFWGKILEVETLPTLDDLPTKNIPYSGDYFIQGENKIWIGVSRAEGTKCERCWNFSPQVGSFVDQPTLCK